MCVCSLSYPACKTLAPYYIATVFCPSLFHKRQDIRKKNVVEHKYVLDLSTKLKVHRDAAVNVRSSSCELDVCSRQFLMESEFPRQILEKYTSVKFHE